MDSANLGLCWIEARRCCVIVLAASDVAQLFSTTMQDGSDLSPFSC